MVPFINIHTHQLSNDNSVCIFNNRFGFDKKIYSETLFSVGIHPWDLALINSNSINELDKVVTHTNCFAVGECGLDKIKDTNLNHQLQIFELQLQLAVKHHKPVIIHCVKALDELIQVCRPFHKHIPLLIHGFSKSSQLAVQLIAEGFYISLNPSLFNKPDFNFSTIDLNHVFLETDTNTALNIEEVYKMASTYFNIGLNDLKEKISLNFESIKL